VGSILYEMLTGVPPYDGENVMEILHKKANQPPQPILELRPDVPAPVVALVEKAMARNPGDRPQSMAELARETPRSRACPVGDAGAGAGYQAADPRHAL